MMNWPKLINWDRFHETRRWPIEPARSPWQIDYDRIIFSSAFRRLQDKTQVFPLSDSDYVRTRLTHSLEVSAVARTLGIRAGSIVLKRHQKEPVDNNGKIRRLGTLVTPGDFGSIVAAAALAHDLGNPPFGHSGEDAVRHWFETSVRLRRARDRMTNSQCEDFRCWEGNAQGFRILTRLQIYRGRGGMRLTNATLATFCKYPAQALHANPDLKRHNASGKKFGVFQGDVAAFERIANATGLLKRKGVPGGRCRHPLAFLMEAADDICYRIVDLEDGFRLRHIAYKTAADILRSIATWVQDSRLNEERDEVARIGYLRAVVISRLVEQVTDVFAAHETQMLEGKFNDELCSLIDSAPTLAAIKDIMGTSVYNARNVLETEAAGFQIIPGLLDLFWTAVTAKEGQRNHRRANKVLQLIPVDFRGPKGISSRAIYERMIRITDYVSGMTDSYALSLYRKLNGIALPT